MFLSLGFQALPPASGGGRSQPRKRCGGGADDQGYGVLRVHSVSGVRHGAGEGWVLFWRSEYRIDKFR